MKATYNLKSSTIAGAAAYAREEEKDIRHEAEVAAMGGLFYPLVVWFWGSYQSSSFKNHCLKDHDKDKNDI